MSIEIETLGKCVFVVMATGVIDVLSAVGDRMYLYGGIDEDGAKTCAEGLYLLVPGEP